MREISSEAARFPQELEAQLLLAEAKCRTEDFAACADAADRALSISPENSAALAWKGLAIARQAATERPAQRAAMLKQARATIAKANRSDPNAVLPLLAYYRSFAEAGERAPDVAVDGLSKVVESVPSAPAPRVLLGAELAARGETAWARRTLLPVAAGPYQSPERARAEELLRQVPAIDAD
jgi:tetratricopeptide (TPR) repeat protein